jgi:hypothetical protein
VSALSRLAAVAVACACATARADDAGEDRALVTGWVLARGDASVRKRPPQLEPLLLPHERASATAQAFLRARYARGQWLEATVSGWFAHDELYAANDFYASRWQREEKAELRELSVSLSSEKVSAHFGPQRVVWGASDLFGPNDVVNARDLRDPILGETDLRRIPSPLARLDADLAGGTLQLLVGLFVPDRFYLYGRDWSVVQPGAPASLQGLLHQAAVQVHPSLERPFEALVIQTSRPRAGVAGARLSHTFGGVDLDAYYHYGYDGTPALTLDPRVKAGAALIDWSNPPDGLISLLDVITADQPAYQATYVRRHHAGLDLVTTAGPFALRVDGAYDSARVFYRMDDFTSFVTGTVQATGGVEYQTGDPAKVVIVEASYLHLWAPPPVPLLGYSRDSALISATARWPIGARFGVDLRGAVGVVPRTLVLRPELAFRRAGLTASAGAALLGGSDHSFGGYYRHASEIYVRVKGAL